MYYAMVYNVSTKDEIDSTLHETGTSKHRLRKFDIDEIPAHF